jgi:hypothetical protein
MPRVRTKKTVAESVKPTDPANVRAAAKIADRHQRLIRLSEIMRDGTGAEVVAASRLMEAMEQRDASSAQQGIPPPTSWPEQVMRLVRIMQANTRHTTLEAIDVYIAQLERRRAAIVNTRNIENLVSSQAFRERRARIPAQKPEGLKNGNSVGPIGSASGEVAAESGVSELLESAEPVGPSENEDERDGDGDYESGEEAGGEV